MKKLTGLSLMLASLALTGCSDKNAKAETHSDPEQQRIVKTVKTTVTGEWVGRTLLPRSGETKQQYEERLNYLNNFEKDMNRGDDFQPRLSIFTQQGVNMYNWARRSQQINKTGNADDYNPATDLYLQMANKMAKGEVVYLQPSSTPKKETAQQSAPSRQATVRRGKTFDF